MKKEILYRAKTANNDIMVTKEGGIITLYSPYSFKQTAINENIYFIPHLEYARNIILCLAFYPSPKSILVLGLGGGAVPVMLHRFSQQTQIDVVEIDSEIAKIAEKYFHFKESERMKLYLDDASRFVEKSWRSYDIIIQNEYIGNKLPETLTTVNFFKNSKRLLSANGIYVANVMSKGKRRYQRLLNDNGFKNDSIYCLPGKKTGNIIMFTTRGVKISTEYLLYHAERLENELPYDFQLMSMIERLERPKTSFFS